MKSRLILLESAADQIGVSADDLKADPNRPLVIRIGNHDYVDEDDLKRFGMWARSLALYDHAGWRLTELEGQRPRSDQMVATLDLEPLPSDTPNMVPAP